VIEVQAGEEMNSFEVMEELENDLYTRLKSVTDTRLKVDANDIVEVFSRWLADNGLAIVNDAQNIIEI
jgi:hypothetical protein